MACRTQDTHPGTSPPPWPAWWKQQRVMVVDTNSTNPGSPWPKSAQRALRSTYDSVFPVTKINLILEIFIRVVSVSVSFF